MGREQESSVTQLDQCGTRWSESWIGSVTESDPVGLTSARLAILGLGSIVFFGDLGSFISHMRDPHNFDKPTNKTQTNT